MARHDLVQIGVLGLFVLLVIAACSLPSGEAPTTTEPEVWGTLTGDYARNFVLDERTASFQMTVTAARVRLSGADVAWAAVPRGLADFLAKGVRVRVVQSDGRHAWTIVEIEGGPTITTSATAATGVGTTRAPGLVVGEYGFPLGSDLARLVIDRFASIDDWVVMGRDPSDLDTVLRTGQIDVFADARIDEQIRQLASDPAYCFGQSLLVGAGNPLGLTDYESVAAAGARIGVIEEDPDQRGYLRAAGVPDDDVTPFPFRELDRWYMALADDEIDAIAISGSAPIWGDLAPKVNNPRLEMTPVFFPLGESGAEVFFCFGFAVGDPELRETINAQLAELHSTGELAALLEEHGLDPIQAERAAALTSADVLARTTR